MALFGRKKEIVPLPPIAQWEYRCGDGHHWGFHYRVAEEQDHVRLTYSRTMPEHLESIAAPAVLWQQLSELGDRYHITAWAGYNECRLRTPVPSAGFYISPSPMIPACGRRAAAPPQKDTNSGKTTCWPSSIPALMYDRIFCPAGSPALAPNKPKGSPACLRRSPIFYFASASRSILVSLIKAEALYSTSTSVMPSCSISSLREPR